MSAQAPIGPRTAIALLLVSALSLLTYLLLSAYESDLSSEQTGAANALSKSAVGFAGIRYLLESADIDTVVGRTPPEVNRFGIVVLTPDVDSSRENLKKMIGPGPRLIVLPKWITMSDIDHPGWVVKMRALSPDSVRSVVSTIAGRSKVSQRHGSGRIRLKAAFGRFAGAVPDRAVTIDSLQTISGKGLDPCIVDEHGAAVLAQIRGTQAYILADADLFNNFGLRDVSVARAAFALPQLLRVSDRPISFDVTLNGFSQSPELLRTVFQPPILGATLCALLAAALLAFHALNRFGDPRSGPRVIPFGKRALADNTAAMLHLMHREVAMAPRYADTMLRVIAIRLGIPRSQADSSWIAAIEKATPRSDRFARLRAEALAARSVGDLMQIATRLYSWKREILRERS
ncbi:MAG TPA: hypothetical protein VLV55_03465 [Rhizomicrobium sp.]|nr:hypothetical protein [Rhizomicrobium sp.]